MTRSLPLIVVGGWTFKRHGARNQYAAPVAPLLPTQPTRPPGPSCILVPRGSGVPHRRRDARSRHNLRHDVVEAVAIHASRLVDERRLQPLRLGITPHKLRRTFASILVAIGEDATYVMQQLGHTNPAFTLRVYSHMMRRSAEEWWLS